jgi:hypothetical protein
VGLASRGLRDMDEGPERIEDAVELARVRRQALRVNSKSVALATVMLLVALALPSLR